MYVFKIDTEITFVCTFTMVSFIEAKYCIFVLYSNKFMKNFDSRKLLLITTSDYTFK